MFLPAPVDRLREQALEGSKIKARRLINFVSLYLCNKLWAIPSCFIRGMSPKYDKYG